MRETEGKSSPTPTNTGWDRKLGGTLVIVGLALLAWAGTNPPSAYSYLSNPASFGEEVDPSEQT